MFYTFDVFIIGMLLGFLGLVIVMGLHAAWKLLMQYCQGTWHDN